MRSPTLNNNPHSSPHEINSNKPPTQQQQQTPSLQQTNGNGVRPIFLFFFIQQSLFSSSPLVRNK